MKAKTGEILYKKIVVKVIFPPKTFPVRRFSFHTPAGLAYNSVGIDGALNEVATKLDTLFPMWDFRLAELKPIGNTIAFNYVYCGLNETYVKSIQEKQ